MDERREKTALDELGLTREKLEELYEDTNGFNVCYPSSNEEPDSLTDAICKAFNFTE